MGGKCDSGNVQCYSGPRAGEGVGETEEMGGLAVGGTTIIQELNEGKHPEKETEKEQSVRWEEHQERLGCGSQEQKEF